MLAGKLSCGELKRSSLYVSHEVVWTEDRVVLRVDRSHPASDLCDHAHGCSEVLRVKVLQCRSSAFGTRVFWIEKDVALLAVDAGSQDEIVLAQLGVDPADDLISLWIKDSLLWLLHQVVSSLFVQPHGAKLINGILRNFLGFRIDSHPEVWVRSLQSKAVHSLCNAVLFRQSNGVVASSNHVTNDVHHVSFRPHGGAAEIPANIKATASSETAKVVVEVTLFAHQRNVVGECFFPSLDPFGFLVAGVFQQLTGAFGDAVNSSSQLVILCLCLRVQVSKVFTSVCSSDVGATVLHLRPVRVSLGDQLVVVLCMAVMQVLLQLANGHTLGLHVLQKWQPLFVLKLKGGVGRATVVQLLLQVRIPLSRNVSAGFLNGLNDALHVDVLVEHLVDQAVLQFHLWVNLD